ncbi:MAG: DUF420 domain-containing protein, partial [Acidobacteria bacterium]|nr:DUF420 domain-containing protein [Acidobacteriota bacterium]
MEITGENAIAKRSNFTINLISFLVPVVVAVLLALPNKLDLGEWTSNLPHVIGVINTLTTIVLVLGLISVKLNKVHLHRALMTTAFSLGGLFLVCYVTYHLTNPANKFPGDGIAKAIYLIILLTHVLLSLVVLPLVLRAMYYAVTNQFVRHKRIVKFAYPIWLYVSVTGVIVYFMLN